MNICKIIGLILFYLSFSVQSLAGTIDPDIPDSKYLDYGSKFQCVIPICGVYEDGGLFCASAVAIDNHHILTAAHVVDNAEVCAITVGDKKHSISRIVIHKDFDQGFGKGDIAIGFSETDLGLDHYPPLYEKNDEIGKICAISGYGLTGTFHTGANKSDNKKRAGSNTIDYIDRDMLMSDPSSRSSSKHTVLEFFLASGDSGGGLFIDGKLAGINSCIISTKGSPKSRYNEEAGHTRVSQFLQWINDNKTKVD